MLRLLGSRIAQALFVILAVAFIAFVLFRFIGDPVSAMLGPEFTIDQRQRLTRELGLDQPTVVQFLHFVQRAVQGDFGFSYRLSRPVTEIILSRLPATIELTVVASTIALGTGIPLGIFTALRPHSLISRSILVTSLVCISMPTFVVGLVLIVVFSVWLAWFPSSGRTGTVELGYWTTSFLTLDGWRSIILPGLTLSLFQLTLFMRLVRAEMLEVLRTDHIRFARVRGLSDRLVNLTYALRSTLVPVITVAGLQIGSIFAFAIITETVFQWPGIGYLFIQSVGTADIPVMAAYLVMTALVFSVINLVVDLLYYAIDPRLRSGVLVFRR